MVIIQFLRNKIRYFMKENGRGGLEHTINEKDYILIKSSDQINVLTNLLVNK